MDWADLVDLRNDLKRTRRMLRGWTTVINAFLMSAPASAGVRGDDVGRTSSSSRSRSRNRAGERRSKGKGRRKFKGSGKGSGKGGRKDNGDPTDNTGDSKDNSGQGRNEELPIGSRILSRDRAGERWIQDGGDWSKDCGWTGAKESDESWQPSDWQQSYWQQASSSSSSSSSNWHSSWHSSWPGSGASTREPPR